MTGDVKDKESSRIVSPTVNREGMSADQADCQSGEETPTSHGPDSESSPLQDGVTPMAEADDVEAAHPAPSGPVYSVFTRRQRQYIIGMVACAGFFSPLSASIYFPALNALSNDLKVSSGLINLSLTTYMIFQGFAPTIFGDLADMAGRRPVLILGFIIYIGANIGLALQTNYAALLILRCLQSAGSSGTIALGSGVVADVTSSGERGKFMGTSSSIVPEICLTLARYCSVRPNGSTCYSTCFRRYSHRISGMAMALLVSDHLGWGVPRTFDYHIP